jgi:hypothetical protein
MMWRKFDRFGEGANQMAASQQGLFDLNEGHVRVIVITKEVPRNNGTASKRSMTNKTGERPCQTT